MRRTVNAEYKRFLHLSFHYGRSDLSYSCPALPLVIFKGKITNRFVQSFLYYVPYAVLGAMTFPSILFSTGNLAASIAGLITACVLSFKEKSLIIVAAFACLASFCVILICQLI